MQSGKTSAIKARAQLEWDENQLCSVVITPNTVSASDQVRDSFNATHPELNAISFSSNKPTAGFRCRVLIGLANKKCVKKINDALDLPGDRHEQYVLIIDEADAHNLFKSSDADKELRTQLLKLFTRATKTVLVTATPFQFMGLPEFGGTLTPANVTWVTPSPRYCSIYELRFGAGTLEEPDDSDDSYIPETEASPDGQAGDPVMPASYIKFVEDFSADRSADPGSDEHTIRALCSADGAGVPMFCLVRVGTTHKVINKAATVARAANPEGQLVFTYTADGVSVHRDDYGKLLLARQPEGAPALPAPPALAAMISSVDHKNRSRRTEASRIPRPTADTFVTIPKGDSLVPLQAFLTRVRVSGLWTKLFCVLGQLGDRGLNVTDSEHKWTLTHEYLLHADSSDIGHVTQMLRIVGNKGWSLDEYKPIVITKRQTLMNIKAGAEACEKLAEMMGRDGPATVANMLEATSKIRVSERPTRNYASCLTRTMIKSDD